jgi:hypothetical protein
MAAAMAGENIQSQWQWRQLSKWRKYRNGLNLAESG